MFGESCAFAHPEISSADQLESSPDEREADADENSQKTSDSDTPRNGVSAPHERRGFGVNRNKVGNRDKCAVFRRWLLGTFGLEKLRSGSGILDVAGGKGELAFELVNVSDVSVTVIDPREMNLARYVKKFRKGYYHLNTSAAVRSAIEKNADAQLFAPRHARVFFTPGMWEWEVGHRKRAMRNSYELAHASRWSRRGLVRDEGEAASANTVTSAEKKSGQELYTTRGETVSQLASLKLDPVRVCVDRDTGGQGKRAPTNTSSDSGALSFDPSRTDPSIATEDARACAPIALRADETVSLLEDVLQKCSVVVGMHPDQATDAVVDFALLKGKPFAVVPCCVYRKDFPKRRRPASPDNPFGGGQVTTHEHLVQYLLAKAPGICKSAVLPFGGMNVVVYSLGGKPGDSGLCGDVYG